VRVARVGCRPAGAWRCQQAAERWLRSRRRHAALAFRVAQLARHDAGCRTPRSLYASEVRAGAAEAVGSLSEPHSSRCAVVRAAAPRR
jgi:hypothetical protein